jgi:DNA-binding NarL/FixJ family response regulator
MADEPGIHKGHHYIRIVLADDHDILRQGLKLLLGLEQDMQVVGEARTGREALELTEKLKPDVVVMDISMADMDGLEACKQIRQQEPATQVLMLTMHESEEYFLLALRMGAAGYLVKKAAPADLQAAVRTVADGGAFLNAGLAKALIRAYVAQPEITSKEFAAPHPAGAQSLSPRQGDRAPTADANHDAKEASLAQELGVLTAREVEVMRLVAEGCTNQEIAKRLILSIKTVQAHRANVMGKLGLHDITQLVRFAIRHGLIPPEPY